MGQALNFQTALYVSECCSCGMTFGVPSDFDVRRRRDGKSFYCPNGHSQSYRGESDAAKIKRLEREAAEERAAKERAYEEAERARRANAALRGQATKLRKRIAAGVCPCCNRSFSDLGAHMTQKHPGYAATEVGA